MDCDLRTRPSQLVQRAGISFALILDSDNVRSGKDVGRSRQERAAAAGRLEDATRLDAV